MIDDPTTVIALMRQMEAQLPIPAMATPELVHTLRKNGVKIASTRRVQIEQVMYLGDEGGIACRVTFSGQAGNGVVVSLTHLRVQDHHPLAQAVRAYQRERTRKLVRGR
jgi:hypothetical protein